MYVTTRLRHLVNAAFCLPSRGFRVGGKTLCDLGAGLVVNLKKCGVKKGHFLISLMSIKFSVSSIHLDSQEGETGPLVPEGKVDPFLVHLHRPRLRVDDHLGEERVSGPLSLKLFQTSLLFVNLPSSAAILSINLYASGSQGGGWKEELKYLKTNRL